MTPGGGLSLWSEMNASVKVTVVAAVATAAVLVIFRRTKRRHAPKGCTELRPSCRSGIRSFKVMDVVHRADQLARAGRKILHLEVLEPLMLTVLMVPA